MKQMLNEWRKYLKENKQQIPSDISERYNKGNCLLFAEAVKKLLGEDASIMSVITSYDGGIHWSTSHVFVRYNNLNIDIDGNVDEYSLLEKSVGEMDGDVEYDLEQEIKVYNPSEWEDFRYDPNEPDEEQDMIDLNKDGVDDIEQTSSPGKMYPEDPQETLKWARIVLSNLNLLKV